MSRNIEEPGVIYAEVVTVDEIEHNITENMLKAYNLGKSVILFAMIDVFFSILYAIYNVYFFIPILFALCGYYGAKNYDKCLTLVYASNIFIVNLVRIVYSSYSYYNLNQNDQQKYIYSFILIVFCGLLGLWISKIICKFYASLKRLNDFEINTLKLVRRLQNARIIYW